MPSTSEQVRDKQDEQQGGSPEAFFAEQHAQIQAARKQLAQAEQAQLAEQKGETAKLQAGFQQAMQQAPSGTPPPAPDLPAPNVVKGRPFAEGLPGQSSTQTLNNALMGLGLMAQMAFGISKGYAQGALASYNGALQGWVHGDHLRAENDWKEYLAQVGRIERDFQNRRRVYEDTWKAWEHDIEARKVQMMLVAAQHGEDRRGLDLIARNVDRAMQELQFSQQLLERQREHNGRLNLMWAMEQSREANQRWMKQLQADMMKERKSSKTVSEVPHIFMDRAGNYAPQDLPVNSAGALGYQMTTPKEEAILHAMPTSMTMLTNLMQTSVQLNNAGGFRTASGPMGVFQRGMLAAEQFAGDVDPGGKGTLLNTWAGQKSELVSLYRQLGEKGNIAAKMMAPQLDALSPGSGFPAVMKMLKYMEGQLLADVRSSRIPGFADKLPKVPDLLYATDPGYQQARQKGLTDQQIQQQYGVLVVK